MPRLKADRAGNAGLLATATVTCPLAWHIQTEVDQGMFLGADVGQVDADLAVVDLAQPAAPLPLHADRSGALLGEGGGVEDQDALWAAQLLADLAGQLGDHGEVVPRRLADELLQGFA